jgi:transposase
MPVAQPIVLNEETRRKLEQQWLGRSTALRVAMRSKIVLLASDGRQNKQIAKTLQVAPRMVTLWRGRFLELGIEGLLKDAPRPGRTPSISPEVTATLIAKTTQSTPTNATQWSTRTMAKETSVSRASVSRIWRANGLKPHRSRQSSIENRAAETSGCYPSEIIQCPRLWQSSPPHLPEPGIVETIQRAR